MSSLCYLFAEIIRVVFFRQISQIFRRTSGWRVSKSLRRPSLGRALCTLGTSKRRLAACYQCCHSACLMPLGWWMPALGVVYVFIALSENLLCPFCTYLVWGNASGNIECIAQKHKPPLPRRWFYASELVCSHCRATRCLLKWLRGWVCFSLINTF